VSTSGKARDKGADALAVTLWKEALEAFRVRDYERAARQMQTLLADHAESEAIDFAAVHLQLGVTLLRLKRTEEGVAELVRSVQLNPYNGRARYKLGVGLARLGRNEEALHSLEEGARLAPDVAEHHWRYSEELRRQHYFQEALDAVQDALDLEPEHAESLQTLKAIRERTWWRKLYWRITPRLARLVPPLPAPRLPRLRRKPAAQPAA
jgi:tetratricopeptide (TPR) repeat protein